MIPFHLRDKQIQLTHNMKNIYNTCIFFIWLRQFTCKMICERLLDADRADCKSIMKTQCSCTCLWINGALFFMNPDVSPGPFLGSMSGSLAAQMTRSSSRNRQLLSLKAPLSFLSWMGCPLWTSHKLAFLLPTYLFSNCTFSLSIFKVINKVGSHITLTWVPLSWKRTIRNRIS